MTKEEALKLYASEGASAAASEAGVSTRTIQRWAAQEGVKSGWQPPILRDHGTAACYIRGCRRDECVEANRQANREVKARRVERFKKGKVTIRHGVSGYSNWDCRCGVCRNAWSAYLRGRRLSADA
jgi:hypothetical protein